VIGAQVFSRRGVEKDERARAIEAIETERLRKDQEDEVKILRDNAHGKISELVVGKKTANRVADDRRGEVWLDAGETMDANDLKQLRQHLAAAPVPTAFMLLIKLPPTDNTIDGEQIASVRLIPNQKGIRFAGRVRETLQASLESLGIPIEGISCRIHRSADQHDTERKQRRARRNVELADLELREVGPQPRLLNCLAEAFQALGENVQAAGYYRHSIDRGVTGSPELLEAFYGLLTIEELDPHPPEARMQVCLKALDSFPLDMQLLCAMGGYLQAAGRWDLALRSYETAYRYGQIHPEVWHMDSLRSVAAECYTLSLQLQGKNAEARQVLEEALRTDPTAQRIRRQLLDMLVKQGDRDAALELVNRDWTGPHRDAMRSAVRGASLAAEQNWISARAYLQVAYQAGCRETLCMRWLCITLMASGAMDDARRLVSEWSHIEPNNVEPRRYLEAITSASSSPPASDTSTVARQLRIDQLGITTEPTLILPHSVESTPTIARPTIQP
jgi:tetratricopeptide (TPR) repeat protein